MVVKEKYRYFGSGEIQSDNFYFHKFGQELALTDEEAFDAVSVGGILKSEDFDLVGWAPIEKSNRHERKGPGFEGRLKLAMEKRKVLIDELAQRLADATKAKEE